MNLISIIEGSPEQKGSITMINPYEKCPVYENDNYLLRFVEMSDAPDLLLVYSDEKSVPLFNSDNCHGDDFHYTSLQRVQSAIEFWQMAYRTKDFVRWSIIDKNLSQAIGTIELFNRRAEDYFNECGLLRLDLRSNYECAEKISEILSLIVPPAFELFGCRMVATKVPPFAAQRKKAVENFGFSLSEETLKGGDDGILYGDYYVYS